MAVLRQGCRVPPFQAAMLVVVHVGLVPRCHSLCLQLLRFCSFGCLLQVLLPALHVFDYMVALQLELLA